MKLFLLKKSSLLLLVLVCFCFCLVAQTEKRIALVIGNKDYHEPDMTLKNPINDANAMESVLNDGNFKVIKVVNGTKETIEKAVENFTESIKDYDVGLFYYSGHGVEIISKGNRMNFIVPVNVSSQITEADVEYKCISSEWIQAKMAESGQHNKTNILIFDACRDNPFRKLKRSIENEAWSPPYLIPTGVITCFSASPNESSLDGKGENGLYTSILLKHIRTPNIEVEEVFKRVRIDIKGLGQQEPVEISKLTNRFYFFRKGNILDTDEDGIPDDIDQCKYEKGLAELNGCPTEKVKTITVNNTLWTASNLNIPIDQSIYYQGINSLDVKNRYGRLYTWEAAKEGCRQLGYGWRLPSINDWRGLLMNYGGFIDLFQDKQIGENPKESLEKFRSTSRFSAVKGGNFTIGKYSNIDEWGYYWSSTSVENSNAAIIYFNSNNIYLNKDQKENYLSVRCVKDL